MTEDEAQSPDIELVCQDWEMTKQIVHDHWLITWGNTLIHTDGKGPPIVPRTRRQRLADWWEDRCDQWFDTRRRIGWAIVEFGEWIGGIQRY